MTDPFHGPAPWRPVLAAHGDPTALLDMASDMAVPYPHEIAAINLDDGHAPRTVLLNPFEKGL